jgi:hypothetical protein
MEGKSLSQMRRVRVQMEAKIKRLEDAYNKLIMCVESVIPDKTRHEAAMEMIKRGERCAGDCGLTAYKSKEE